MISTGPVNEYHLGMPCTAHLKRIVPSGERCALCISAAPMEAGMTRSFWRQARDFGTLPEHNDFFPDFGLCRDAARAARLPAGPIQESTT